MESDRDEPIALPPAPPPRPAARRAAIDAALLRFDGGERAPAARKSPGWASITGRPTGALVAVAIVAIIGIPAIQVALREPSPPAAFEDRQPSASGGEELATPQLRPPAVKPVEPDPGGAEPESLALSPSPQKMSRAKEASALALELEQGQMPRREAPPPAITGPLPTTATATSPAPFSAPAPAPAPAPPPPPPASPLAESAADAASDGNIIVTGSRVSRSNGKAASPPARTDPFADFLVRLHAALGSGDRGTILQLVQFPLKVSSQQGVRTYQSAAELERDFERVFTPSVRRSARLLKPDALRSRDGGRLRGGAGIWFGCGQRSCATGSAIQIIEMTAP